MACLKGVRSEAEERRCRRWTVSCVLKRLILNGDFFVFFFIIYQFFNVMNVRASIPFHLSFRTHSKTKSQ